MEYVRDALRKAWSDVEKAYEAEKLNSERALQASIYNSLMQNLSPEHYTVLVEPGWNFIDPPQNQCAIPVPDLVIVRKEKSRKTVLCAMEIKFAPHWWITRANIIKDLEKLDTYRKTKQVRLDIFGPRCTFDRDSRRTGQVRFRVAKTILLVFVNIARKNKDLEIKSYEVENNLRELLEYDSFQFHCLKTSLTGELIRDDGHCG